MSSFEARIDSPADLTKPYAEALFISGELSESMDTTSLQEYTLGEINKLADDMQMLGGNYVVETQQAYTIMHALTPDVETHGNPIRLPRLSFEGALCTAAILKIGRIINGNSVRSLCLAFDDVTLYGRDGSRDRVNDNRFLYVQPHAVRLMFKIG